MIVRDRPSGFRLFVTMRGSVLTQIWRSLLVTTVLAVIVTLTHGTLMHHKIVLTTIPFTLMGLPLAIFLGFRNNAAYDRFWEGRKLWGDLVLKSRNFARQCDSMIARAPDGPNGGADEAVRMIYRTIAFAHALRHHLRGSDALADLMPLLSELEWRQTAMVSSRPHFLMKCMGADLRLCLEEGRIDSVLMVALDDTLCGMVAAAAACERIRTTPIPFSYTLLLHRTAYLYCFLLPFGLVDAIGSLTPLVVAIVAYTFFGLDALGDEIEEPFGTSANDLPLEAICRGIEISLRESLGEKNIPPPCRPVDYQLR
jgi:putative membrane protein